MGDSLLALFWPSLQLCLSLTSAHTNTFFTQAYARKAWMYAQSPTTWLWIVHHWQEVCSHHLHLTWLKVTTSLLLFQSAPNKWPISHPEGHTQLYPLPWFTPLCLWYHIPIPLIHNMILPLGPWIQLGTHFPTIRQPCGWLKRSTWAESTSAFWYILTWA